MKIKLVILTALLLGLLGLEFASAQEANFNFIGSGARARGMGGAFIGVADDATAISWNPAGLATLEKPEASVVGLYSMDKYTAKAIYSSASLAANSFEEQFDQSHPSFNFASAAVPLIVAERNFVFAAAYQRLIDFYYEEENDSTVWEETGGVDAISPGIGVQVTPQVSLGASVNVWTGHFDYKYTDRVNSANNEEANDWYKYSGLNFNIGLMGHFERAKIGAVLKTPLTLKEKYSLAGTDYTNKWKFPMIFGFGASFMPNQNWTLAADYEVRRFSQAKLYDDITGTETSFDGVYEDGHQFRMGVEYLLVQDFGVLPLRVGFRTDPWLSRGLDDEKVTGLTFTGGIGVIVGNIWFDAAYELGSAKTETNQDFDGDSLPDQLSLRETTHNITVSAVIHFEPFE
jgi:long-subunit fatty acid transport protein